MNASYEERSVWMQMIAMLLGMGGYFVVAGQMLARGVRSMSAFAGLFLVATVLMVVFLVAGLVVAAIASRPEGRDERDRLIEWQAESRSSWVVATGVLTAVTGMAFGIENVWIAHLLLLSLVISEVLGFVLRLIAYRRGV